MKHFLALAFICTAFAGKSQLTSLQNINSWAYQLQYTNPQQIATDNSFQLLVTDYSSDAGPNGVYTAAQVAQMKTGGKKVIAYISIGEAENYRYYWQPGWDVNPPAWMGPENPYWAGNFKVKFWYPEWQNIIYSYVDTLVAKGYDGIYMDIVEAFYYWQEENPQEPYADTLMIDFIGKLRHRVDSLTGNTAFIVMPQNAEEIIDGNNVTTELKNKYFDCINAIGCEDIFFPGNNDMNNAHSVDTYRIGLLDEYKNRGKRVFSIEYIDEPAKLTQYIADAQANNYVPYACTRALDYICTQLPTAVPEEIAPAFNFTFYGSEGTLLVNANTNGAKYNFTLTDMLGKMYYTMPNCTENTKQFNALPSGVYIATVQCSNIIKAYKIVVR